jgi:sortase A
VHLQVPVLEGTDDFTLNRAAGHIAGTAAPGDEGNVGIAGHRDGFFRALKDIRVGDDVDLQTQRTDAHYSVDETLIVSAEDVYVLEARAKPSLTLVTCYPFYILGSAPKRFIVHASVLSSTPLGSTQRLRLEN